MKLKVKHLVLVYINIGSCLLANNISIQRDCSVKITAIPTHNKLLEASVSWRWPQKMWALGKRLLFDQNPDPEGWGFCSRLTQSMSIPLP